LFSWIELVAVLVFMRLPAIASVELSEIERTNASAQH
jgi:hypothetical protein